MAAATSRRSVWPSPNSPSLVPCSDAVPRVLNRSTARSASAGSRYDALRSTWLSIIPPAVGSGCRPIRVAAGARPSGSASSPTRLRPSAVRSVSGFRTAGRTVDARISLMLPLPLACGALLRHRLPSSLVANPAPRSSVQAAPRPSGSLIDLPGGRGGAAAAASTNCASACARPDRGTPPTTPRRAERRAGSPDRSPGTGTSWLPPRPAPAGPPPPRPARSASAAARAWPSPGRPRPRRGPRARGRRLRAAGAGSRPADAVPCAGSRPEPDAVDDEDGHADEASQLLGEQPQRLLRWLRLRDPVDSESGVGECAERGRQRPAPELLRDLDAALVPGIGHQLGVEVAASLRRQLRRERVI